MEKHMFKQENGENSYIKITGEVGQEPCYSHTSFGERFYEVAVEVKRLSGNIDKVPVILPERFCSQLKAGSHVGIRGQLRTHSKDVGNHRQVLLRIFAREVWEAQDYDKGINQVELNGFLCKEPIYRRTPLNREITDLMVAVNRPYGKSDYIPCICWGKDARKAGGKKHRVQGGLCRAESGRRAAPEYCPDAGRWGQRAQSMGQGARPATWQAQ